MSTVSSPAVMVEEELKITIEDVNYLLVENQKVSIQLLFHSPELTSIEFSQRRLSR